MMTKNRTATAMEMIRIVMSSERPELPGNIMVRKRSIIIFVEKERYDDVLDPPTDISNKGNISSRFSSNFKANASKMFPCYCY